MLSGLFKSAVPFIKQGVKQLGKQALRTGVEIASDALGGKDIKSASKNRLRQAGLRIVSDVVRRPRKKRDVPRRRPLKSKAPGLVRRNAVRKRTKRTLDIFDK